MKKILLHIEPPTRFCDIYNLYYNSPFQEQKVKVKVTLIRPVFIHQGEHSYPALNVITRLDLSVRCTLSVSTSVVITKHSRPSSQFDNKK